MGSNFDPGAAKSTTKKIVLFFRFIRVEHTLFSLPFAYIGSFLALRNIPTLLQFLLIAIAVFGARTGGMAINNLADRKIDRLNPRTKDRPTATGIISAKETIYFVIFGYLLFEISTYFLNSLSFKLSPFVVLIGVIYPYTKRFTSNAHLFMGLNNGIAPVGGWIAVSNSFDPRSLFLFFAVMLWVAGFDIIYSLMDEDFDRSNHLHSFPVLFGKKRSLYISLIFHILTIFLLITFYFTYPLSIYYIAFIIIIAILLFYQHYLVNLKLENIEKAFNINLYIAILLFFSIILGVFL